MSYSDGRILPLLRIFILGAAAGARFQREPPRRKVLHTEPFTFHLSPLPLRRQLHTRSDRGYGSLSVWFVDSAVRWQRNGAGGLRKIVVRLRLFAAGFIGFAIRRIARAAAGFQFLRRCRHQFPKLCPTRSTDPKVLVPKPAGRVLRASAGRGFGSPG